MQLINIGYGNLLSGQKLVAVVAPDASPIKRMIAQAKEKNLLIDATCGRKTRSVLIMDSDHIILSSLSIDTIFHRTKEDKENGEFSDGKR